MFIKQAKFLFLIRNSLFYEHDSTCLILFFLFKYRFSSQTETDGTSRGFAPSLSKIQRIVATRETRRGADVEISFSLRLESGITVPRDGNAISGNSRLRSDGVSPFTRVKKNKFQFYYVCYYYFLAFLGDIRLQRAQFRNFESKYDPYVIFSGI